MSEQPRRRPDEGWFPDPLTKGQERWWTGTEWTDQVRPAQPRPVPPLATTSTKPPAAPAAAPQRPRTGSSVAPRRRPGELDPFQPVFGQRLDENQPGGPTSPTGPGPRRAVDRRDAGVVAAPETEDGVALASIPRRIAAGLLDLLVVEVLGMLLSLPVVLTQSDLIQQVADEMLRPGATTTSIAELMAGIPSWVQLSVVAIHVAVWFVYGGLMLQLAQSTLGQLATGTKVVPVDRGHERLTPGGAWGRSFAWALVWLSGQVPVLQLLSWWAVLRMAWTPRRQNLADLVCGTQVVRRG